MRYCIIFMALFLLGEGCSRHPRVVYNQPEQPKNGYYDMVWVEPQMYLVDSLFTLIRADRVDSVFIEKNQDQNPVISPSVMFKVDRTSCYSTVSLLDIDGRIIRLLLATNLPYGYYKFSLNRDTPFFEKYSEEAYLLRADYCGRSISTILQR